MLSPSKKGFTLLELLVVIAIIILLVALLMPALNGGTRKSKEVQCLSNMRQLCAAWASYAGDHDGAFLSSEHGAATAWVLSGNTKDTIDQGGLWPYVKDYSVYHCPLDDSGGGINSSNNHLRSYSMSGRINGSFDINSGAVSTAERMGNLTPAAGALLFIEENDPRGYNMGSWVINAAPSTQWIDFVPAWHQNGINLAFCDGHAEHWTWKDAGTAKLSWFYADAIGTNSYNDLKRLQAVFKP